MKFLNFFLRMNSLFNRNMTLNCLWIVLFIFLFPGFLVSLYHNQIVVISLLMRPSKGRSDKQRGSINRQESSIKTPTTDRNWQKKWQFVTGTIQHFSSLEMFFTKFFLFFPTKSRGGWWLGPWPLPLDGYLHMLQRECFINTSTVECIWKMWCIREGIAIFCTVMISMIP